MRDFKQLTPKNAQRVLEALRLLHIRGGSVMVSSNTTAPFRPRRIHFYIEPIHGVDCLIVEADGLGMPSPIMPAGFTPRRSGDTVTYFRLSGSGKVFFRYRDGGQRTQRWRTFES